MSFYCLKYIGCDDKMKRRILKDWSYAYKDLQLFPKILHQAYYYADR